MLNESDIDMTLATKLANGSQELAEELLDMLAKTMPEDFDDIKKVYSFRDWGKLYDSAHRLYGSLCYCGAPKLQKAGKSLKLAAYEHNEVGIDSAYQDLSSAIEQFFEAYNKHKQIQKNKDLPSQNLSQNR